MHSVVDLRLCFHFKKAWEALDNLLAQALTPSVGILEQGEESAHQVVGKQVANIYPSPQVSFSAQMSYVDDVQSRFDSVVDHDSRVIVAIFAKLSQLLRLPRSSKHLIGFLLHRCDGSK
jgi:hypothetical protein